MPEEVINLNLYLGDQLLRNFPPEVRKQIRQTPAYKKLRYGIGLAMDKIPDSLISNRELKIKLEQVKIHCQQIQNYPVVNK